ncbi:MAG: sugar phosphate nucleotidyltransferase [Bacteroidales bacterium]|nr:sugar phosphate nucleotidyltransferase [Bacteroidales bacterium]
MIKKAMILAAGLGTRLGDVTLNKPKALVEIGGEPMLFRLLKKMKKAGIEQVVINVHHHARQIMEEVRKQGDFGMEITFSDESDQLLDTGGALVKAMDFFTGDQPILIHNADILTNLNLNDLLQFHVHQQAEATLYISNRASSRALLFDDDKLLTGWANLKTNNFKWVNREKLNYKPLAFNGVWITMPHFVKEIPFTGKFSIIDAWLSMASRHKIIGFENNTVQWFDLGTPEKIAFAEEFLKMNPL